MSTNSRTTTGTCRLCKQTRELLNSHIWPAFGYKDFVSDQSKGGAFINLESGRFFNKQVKRYWYCFDCEQLFSRFETYAKLFLAQIDETKPKPLGYTEQLHAFCVSICLRSVEYCQESKGFKPRSKLARAHLAWREYLLGKKSDVGPYSIHAFLIVDERTLLHNAMGGHIFEDVSIALCQVGSLLIASPIDRASMRVRDLKAWDFTEVNPEGGIIKPWECWKPGVNVSEGFFVALTDHHRNILNRVKSQDWGLS